MAFTAAFSSWEEQLYQHFLVCRFAKAIWRRSPGSTMHKVCTDCEQSRFGEPHTLQGVLILRRHPLYSARFAACGVQGPTAVMLSCNTYITHYLTVAHHSRAVEFTTFGCFFVQIFQHVSSYHSKVRSLCNFMKRSTLRLRWTVLLSCNVL
jgi:hypothetical protein